MNDNDFLKNKNLINNLISVSIKMASIIKFETDCQSRPEFTVNNGVFDYTDKIRDISSRAEYFNQDEKNYKNSKCTLFTRVSPNSAGDETYERFENQRVSKYRVSKSRVSHLRVSKERDDKRRVLIGRVHKPINNTSRFLGNHTESSKENLFEYGIELLQSSNCKQLYNNRNIYKGKRLPTKQQGNGIILFS